MVFEIYDIFSINEAKRSRGDELALEVAEDSVLAPANSTDDATFGAKCPEGELLCMSDLSCIRFEQFCDGTKDCSDGADESDCVGDDEEEAE